MRHGVEPSPSSSGRSAGLAAAATTVVALLAMAAAAPRTPVLVGSGSGPAEVALSRSESNAVRAVAAVVARAARDLLAGGHVTAALPAPSASSFSAAVADARLVVPGERPSPERLRLAERLLDLPPPGV